MPRTRPEGTCHICGQVGPLTFEHVPPRAAFNDRPMIAIAADQAYGIGPDDCARGRIQQRGAGDFTLCGKCNSDTGHWYGGNFADWCHQGMRILAMSGGNPSLVHLNYLFPLRVLKQIIVMFFSVNGDGFRRAHPELVPFVLNKTTKYLSPSFRFFVYYNIEGRQRYSGVTARWDARRRDVLAFSEITYPPYGYVMTFGKSPPDRRLIEISHFARYDYDEWTVMELRLPALPTHLAFPGDYRTRDEIARDYVANLAADPEHIKS